MPVSGCDLEGFRVARRSPRASECRKARVRPASDFASLRVIFAFRCVIPAFVSTCLGLGHRAVMDSEVNTGSGPAARGFEEENVADCFHRSHVTE